MAWGSLSDIENSVLRDRLKDAKQAGYRIKELLGKTRMNPEIRALVMQELETITNWYGDPKKK